MAATEKRDLRTGEIVWDDYPSEAPRYGRLIRSRKVDVAIVGAGITGALVAEAVSAAGLSVLVLDRRQPAKGSTAASTALLQFEIDTPLVRLADQIGFAPASRAWRRSFEAVNGLATLIERQAIACAFRPRHALYLSGDVLDPQGLAREAELRASIGLPSRYVDRTALFSKTGIAHEAAVLSGGAADVNPVQLTHGLLRVAAARGVEIFAPVELSEVEPQHSTVGLATADGVEIEAKALVFATGYELAKGVPAAGHRRSSTWAFATRPQPSALRAIGQAVIWEASDPYLYIRTTVDGRLVVGGADEDIDDEQQRDALIDDKVRELQQKTRALLPWLDVEADFTWAGTFGESATGLPTVGPVPGMPHCHAVLGYGGNGITFGYLAAQLLGASLTGKDDPDASIFAFGT